MNSPWEWNEIWSNLEKIALAFAISLPVGWQREKEAHSVGIRTFPIVAMAACGYILVAQSLAPHDIAASSRLLQGLVTGIGFIGGGAILKDGLFVRGASTAASIWNVGAVGAAVAIGRYEIAIALSLLNLMTLYLLIPLKKKLMGENDPTAHAPSAER